MNPREPASKRRVSIELPGGPFASWLGASGTHHQLARERRSLVVSVLPAAGRLHIRPDEAKTLKRIPKALLFPAPGMPRGHLLMGYDDNGYVMDQRAADYTKAMGSR